jgi:hypothetical protein
MGFQYAYGVSIRVFPLKLEKNINMGGIVNHYLPLMQGSRSTAQRFSSSDGNDHLYRDPEYSWDAYIYA